MVLAPAHLDITRSNICRRKAPRAQALGGGGTLHNQPHVCDGSLSLLAPKTLRPSFNGLGLHARAVNHSETVVICGAHNLGHGDERTCGPKTCPDSEPPE